MKWFEGTIADAVKVSKEKNAIFTVFIEGTDALSSKLRGFVEDRRISGKLENDSFVVIKVEGGSEAYMQFASIYQIVPVPSLFFIGQSGSPLEIATGVIESVDELEKKVLSALSANGSSLPEPINPSPAPQPSTSQEPEVVCNDGVCYIKPKAESTNEEQQHPSTPPPTPVSLQPPELEPSVPETKPSSQDNSTTQEQLKKRLEEIRVQKEIESREKEKEREIQRRKDGKDLQTFQEKQKEMEYKELKESIKREKKQEQEARQKILDQIANDRKERAQKMMKVEQDSTTSQTVTKTETVPVQKPVINSDSTKIQFRVPNGETHANTFQNSTAFSEIRNYVKNTILQGSGISNFTLVTTYPRKEFTFDDDTKSLLDLGLCPSGVILVIVKAGSAAKVIARTGGIANIFNTIFWGILSPVFAVLGYFKRAIFGGGDASGSTRDTGAQKRSSEEEISANDLAKKRNLDRFTGIGSSVAGSSTNTAQSEKLDNAPYRRAGSNIHRLADQKDDDDDNATWNGNSTQQQ